MAKLISLWFFRNSRLPSCKSTVLKVTSNCFRYRIVWPDWSNRRWQRFPSILSITEQGVMPYVWSVMLTTQLTQDEVMLRTRLSKISSFLFHSGRVFLVLTFTGWGCRSGRPIMDEYRVVIFLVSSLSIPKIDCCLKCHKSKLSQKKKKLNIIYI